jgi:tetratricopeptide (TPR) repeat protein
MSRLEKLLVFYESNPTDAFILFALAKEYENNENSAKALEFYNILVTTIPDYVGTYYHLGKLQEALGNAKEAFQTYKIGMQVATKANDRHAYNELAEAKLALGDEDDLL